MSGGMYMIGDYYSSCANNIFHALQTVLAEWKWVSLELAFLGNFGDAPKATLPQHTPTATLSTRDAYKFKFPGWPDAGCSWWSIVTSMVPRRGRRFEGLTGYPPCACNFGQLQAADLWCCKQLFRPGVHMQDPLHSATHFRRPYSTIQKSRFNFNP